MKLRRKLQKWACFIVLCIRNLCFISFALGTIIVTANTSQKLWLSAAVVAERWPPAQQRGAQEGAGSWQQHHGKRATGAATITSQRRKFLPGATPRHGALTRAIAPLAVTAVAQWVSVIDGFQGSPRRSRRRFPAEAGTAVSPRAAPLACRRTNGARGFLAVCHRVNQLPAGTQLCYAYVFMYASSLIL